MVCKSIFKHACIAEVFFNIIKNFLIRFVIIFNIFYQQANLLLFLIKLKSIFAVSLHNLQFQIHFDKYITEIDQTKI